MIKLTAALLICAAGYLSGQLMTDRLRLCVSSADALILLTDRTIYLIRESTLNIYELFARLREVPSLNRFRIVREFPECFDTATDIRTSMHELIQSDTGLSEEEKDLLHRFAAQIGTSDAERQTEFLAGLRKDMTLLHERRSCEYREKSRLYRSVGLLCGAMAGILII